MQSNIIKYNRTQSNVIEAIERKILGNIRLPFDRQFFKEAAMLNNYVVQQKKNNNTAMHDYCIIHILIIMHGCIIVFMLDYINIHKGTQYGFHEILHSR